MSTINLTRNYSPKETKEQLLEPKLYVIVIVAKVEEGSFVITLCPNCFIEFFNSFPGKQYIIITPHECFNDLKTTGKTIITKPLSKQIAETYLDEINVILKMYSELHDMSEVIAKIQEV